MKEIPLTRGQVALVDDEDYAWVSQWKWCCAPQKHKVEGKFHAVRGVLKNGKVKLLYMHRVILGVVDGLVDHRDGNGLNNQRSNIRPCTYSQNQMNRSVRFDRYKGVHFDKRLKAWTAYIFQNKKKIHLGRFEYSTDAAIAYNEAATKLFGEFARLNPIPE